MGPAPIGYYLSPGDVMTGDQGFDMLEPHMGAFGLRSLGEEPRGGHIYSCIHKWLELNMNRGCSIYHEYK